MIALFPSKHRAMGQRDLAGQNTCKATKDDGQQQDAVFLLAGDKWDRFVLGFGLGDVFVVGAVNLCTEIFRFLFVWSYEKFCLLLFAGLAIYPP